MPSSAPHNPDPSNSTGAGAVERISKNPLALLLAGFLMTGLLGPCLAADYQERSRQSQRDAELREARRTAALMVVDSVSALLNRGYYIYGRYYDAVHDPAYRDSLTAWRANFHAFNKEFEAREIVDAGKVCTYFGAEVQEQLLGVSDSLHWLNFHLREYEAGRWSTPEVAGSLENIKRMIYDFCLKMVDGLSDEQPIRSQRCGGKPPKVPRPTT